MEEFTREQYYDIVQDIVLKHGVEIFLDKDTVAADQEIGL